MNDDTDTLSDDINNIRTSDDKLFQDPPPKDDCPLCMQPVPFHPSVCDVGTIHTCHVVESPYVKGALWLHTEQCLREN